MMWNPSVNAIWLRAAARLEARVSVAECEDARARAEPTSPEPGESGASAAHDAAEADVRRRRVDGVALPSGGPVAQAVVGCAEVRAALGHSTGDRLSRLELGVRHARVAGGAARALDLLRVGAEEIRRPLPDVPRHVVEAEPVRREALDRRRPLEAVELEVLPGELALPGVRHGLTAGKVFVAPGEGRSLEPAARGVLPLRFRRQLLAGPGGVRLRVLERDLHDGMVVAAVDRRALAARVLPVRARHVLPPVA